MYNKLYYYESGTDLLVISNKYKRGKDYYEKKKYPNYYIIKIIRNYIYSVISLL